MVVYVFQDIEQPPCRDAIRSKACILEGGVDDLCDSSLFGVMGSFLSGFKSDTGDSLSCEGYSHIAIACAYIDECTRWGKVPYQSADELCAMLEPVRLVFE
jgi:hypothetical protein